MGTTSPYREAPPFDEKPPRTRLVYTPEIFERRGITMRVLLANFILSVAAAALFVRVDSPIVKAIGLLAVATGFVWAWRAWTALPRVDISVENGRLVIGGITPTPTPVSLHRLSTVRIDTKEIQIAGAANSIGSFVTETRVGTVDVARIIVVPMGASEGTPLSEEFCSYDDTIRSLGKIRTFLRRHGWVPEEERD